MRVPQFAKRTLTALALTALAACGKDSAAPDPEFDPAGTSEDIGAMQQSFESPVMAGYVAASGAISTALGPSAAAMAVRAVPTKALVVGTRDGAARLAAAARTAPRSQPAVAAAVVPAEYLGVTFTYDPETDEYGPSELPGAPADGVRFIVYSVNPINGLPTEPLVEVGYADIVTTESANAASVRVELVSNAITYLDYTVAFTGSSTEITMAVTGFVSNGEDRVDFDLDNQASSTAISVDYVLTVPTRDGFRLAIELDASESVATVNIDVRGAHGRVQFSGSVTDGAGTVDIEVNGELFATMTVTEQGEPVFTGADGQPLNEQELEALRDIFQVVGGGMEFFGDLIDPMD